jgi:hypothetical protein
MRLRLSGPMCFSMLLYRRHKAVSPVPDKVTRMEVLPAPLAQTEGEYYEVRAFQCDRALWPLLQVCLCLPTWFISESILWILIQV